MLTMRVWFFRSVKTPPKRRSNGALRLCTVLSLGVWVGTKPGVCLHVHMSWHGPVISRHIAAPQFTTLQHTPIPKGGLSVLIRTGSPRRYLFRRILFLKGSVTNLDNGNRITTRRFCSGKTGFTGCVIRTARFGRKRSL